MDQVLGQLDDPPKWSIEGIFMASFADSNVDYSQNLSMLRQPLVKFIMPLCPSRLLLLSRSHWLIY